jgi:hypothetical protein
MSNVNLNLNMGDVKVAVQDAIKPAVEAALAGYDVKAAIVNVLKQPIAPAYDRYYGLSELQYVTASDYGAKSKKGAAEPTLLDQYVKSGIREIAKQYVAEGLKAQRPAIEKGLAKMLASSTNKLTKAFSDAATKALAADWSFSFSANVGHELAERSDYD